MQNSPNYKQLLINEINENEQKIKELESKNTKENTIECVKIKAEQDYYSGNNSNINEKLKEMLEQVQEKDIADNLSTQEWKSVLKSYASFLSYSGFISSEGKKKAEEYYKNIKNYDFQAFKDFKTFAMSYASETENSVNGLDRKLSTIFVRIYSKEPTKMLQYLTEEQAKYVYENKKLSINPVEYRDEDVVTTPNQNKVNEYLNSSSLDQEDKDALEFYGNIQYGNEVFENKIKPYLKALADTQLTEIRKRINKIPNKNEDLLKHYEKVNSDFDGYIEKDDNKEKEYKQLSNNITELTKKIMRDIMYRLDKMNLINDANKTVGEEPYKYYAFIGLNNAKNAVQDAMKKNDPQKIAEAAKKYKSTYQEYEKLLKLAKDNFLTDGFTYGGNIDVIRTESIPYLFRKEFQATSQINSLFLALKTCKLFNITIDEFCENPSKAAFKIYQKMTEGLSIEKIFEKKSLAEKLHDLGNENADVNKYYGTMDFLISRTMEGLVSFEKEPKCLDQNYYMFQIYFARNDANKSWRLFYNSYNKKNNPKVFENIFVYKENEVDFFKCYKDSKGTNVNLKTFKETQPLDKDAYIKTTQYDYAKHKEMIENTLKELCKLQVSKSKRFLAAVKGASMAIESILTLKVEDKNKTSYKELAKFGSNLKSEKFVNQFVKNSLNEELRTTKGKIETLTGHKINDNSILNITNFQKNEKLLDENAVYLKMIKPIYQDSILKHGLAPENSKIDEIINLANHYLTTLKGANQLDIDVIKDVLEDNSKKNCIDLLKREMENNPLDMITSLMNSSIEDKSDRTRARANKAVEIVTTSLENKNKDEGFAMACSALKVLKEKHATRGGLWMLFHFFGQYKAEKNAIETINAKLKEKGYTETQINENLAEDKLKKNFDIVNHIDTGINSSLATTKSIFHFTNDQEIDLGIEENKLQEEIGSNFIGKKVGLDNQKNAMKTMVNEKTNEK